MRSQYTTLLLVISAAAASSAQETPVRETQASVTQPIQLIGGRDKDGEDQIARLFETIRSNSKVSKLRRIKHRDSLEQYVCTIAQTGSLPKHPSTNTFGVYRTSQPELVSAEIQKVASFNKLKKSHPSYARYSIAVWKVKDPQTGEPSFWVGVQLYWSAAMEFFDYHFTDDIYYHNYWKKTVAPQCRGK